MSVKCLFFCLLVLVFRGRGGGAAGAAGGGAAAAADAAVRLMSVKLVVVLPFEISTRESHSDALRRVRPTSRTYVLRSVSIRDLFRGCATLQ